MRVPSALTIQKSYIYGLAKESRTYIKGYQSLPGCQILFLRQ